MKKHIGATGIFFTMLVFGGLLTGSLHAQSTGLDITGIVLESGTGSALGQVAVSVASTGISSTTDEQGTFTITVPDLEAEIILNLPGYNMRRIYLNGRDYVQVYLVPAQFRSFDNLHNSPLGPQPDKNAIHAFTPVHQDDIQLSRSTSFDQTLKGKIPGMHFIQKSGMPGQGSYMNIRGFSSLLANTEPLLFIDGMIHEYWYAKESLMEGFALNAFDVVDIDDIYDISVLRDGNSYLGSASSNGVVYINTEQKVEASTVIKFSAYGGVTLVPSSQPLLGSSQFRTYFSDALFSEGLSQSEIDALVPWLNGDQSSEDYYKYNNSTDWQRELFTAANLSKFHFFIKGGDDIATYNISTGYTAQNSIYDNSRYTRFNLRINGRVNITQRFSITPNVKLSLADSKLANHGPGEWKNPILSALLKPSIMAPIARDETTGDKLTFLDDVGVFGVSNPVAIVSGAQGVNRNYHFLSSVRADYRFNERFNLHTTMGINFNNAKENIFLPDHGIVQVDSAYNSPGDFVIEYRSTQNHTALSYNNATATGHNYHVNVGFRYLLSSYKHNKSIDLNTPSDDFKNLGDGSQFSFLRTTTGDDRELAWVSFFGDMAYNFRNRYFFNGRLAYDGSSVTNQKNRYNLYPFIGAAWRISSEHFLNQVLWLEDLKLRGSYSQTGNLFTSVYDYSKLYYTDRRLNANGVLTREAIPNEDLSLEKKVTLNAGLDLSLFQQILNLHVDFYTSRVDNLVIPQELPASFGFNTYFDNGGNLSINGFEIGADTRIRAGNFSWSIGGTVAKSVTKVESMEFMNPDTKHIITSVPGADFITAEGNPINAFYGYKTEGIISLAEAGTITGPLGETMQAGDIKYADLEPDNVIDHMDKTVIGNPNPDLFGGLFTMFSYKQFEMKAQFTYSVGNDIFNYVRFRTESMSTFKNQAASVLDRWTDTNTSANMPRISISDPSGNSVFSDRWIEDGSYLRLNQLTLSYRMPSKTGFFREIVIYATATNLLTLTNYSGYDPEFMYSNSPFYMGIDYGMIPQTRSFILGLKLDL